VRAKKTTTKEGSTEIMLSNKRKGRELKRDACKLSTPCNLLATMGDIDFSINIITTDTLTLSRNISRNQIINNRP